MYVLLHSILFNIVLCGIVEFVKNLLLENQDFVVSLYCRALYKLSNEPLTSFKYILQLILMKFVKITILYNIFNFFLEARSLQDYLEKYLLTLKSSVL